MERTERTGPVSGEALWAVLSDLDTWGERLPTMERVTRVEGDGPIGVGARFEVSQPGLATSTYEITEWTPGVGFTWRAAVPGVRTAATHEIRPIDGRSRLVLGLAWRGPLAGIVRLVYGRRTKKMLGQEAETLMALAAEA